MTGQDDAADTGGAARKFQVPEGVSRRVADEVDYVIRQFRAHGIAVGVVYADGGIGYLYAENQILVPDEYLREVVTLLWRDRDANPPAAEVADRIAADRVERVIAGLVLLRLDGSGYSVPEALDLVDERLGEGIATPDHVFTVAGETSICPATEPVPGYDGIEPTPPVCRTDAGAGVRIYAADTGLLTNAAAGHPWLAGVNGEEDPNTPPAPTSSTPLPPIKPYSGHGTFVAGVLRCVAPAAQLHVDEVFSIAGSHLESHGIRRMVHRGLRNGVDIIHLTIAATTRKDLPPIGFAKWLELVARYKGVVCVVAAGNSGSARPTWPAAFPQVVSVGALTADGGSRADFSNHGGWVDVYAPGWDIVNAYATGVYTCYAAPYAGQERTFYGMARWSGTSFATPIVTGLIAARMYRTGESGLEAAAALLAQARAQAIPGVGAILLPTCQTAPAPAGCGCGDGRCGCGCGCQ